MEHNMVYNEVMSYCKKRGLIDRLEESFLIPESERFSAMHIAQSGLDVLDAVHCIYDVRRTGFFMEEIKRQVSKGDIVIEAGIGTGILSFYAASLGAKVYGCEINPEVFELAQEIKHHLEENSFFAPSSVEFFLHDAITFIPPKNADVLISENIYTGMFFEYQVQITNNLLSYLNTDGVCIPQKMRSFTSLSQTIFPRAAKRNDLFIPSEETGEKIVYTLLSDPDLYDEIDFTKVSDTSVQRTLAIPVRKEGAVNSLLIYSEIIMPSGKVIRKEDTTFLNSEIIIAISPPVAVRKGDTVELTLHYHYSGKPKDALIKIRKIVI